MSSGRHIPRRSIKDEDMKATGSPGNSLSHGLTAKKILPERLRQHTAVLREQLASELRPASALEALLVDELARHGAALKFTSRAEPAVLRRGAAAEMQLAAIVGTDISSPADVSLCGAVTSDGLERLTRYRRAHERGFYAALSHLTELKTQRPFPSFSELRERFVTEAACREHLVERRKVLACSRCGCAKGAWLETRSRWECSECKVQLGIRTGTVLEHSPLPLACWFAAILAVAVRPTVTIAELREATGIERMATIKAMVRKILAASSSPPAEADLLLAGLPQFCASSTTSFYKTK